MRVFSGRLSAHRASHCHEPAFGCAGGSRGLRFKAEQSEKDPDSRGVRRKELDTFVSFPLGFLEDLTNHKLLHMVLICFDAQVVRVVATAEQEGRVVWGASVSHRH